MDLAHALARHAGRQVTPIRSQFDLRVTRSSDPDPNPRLERDNLGAITTRGRRRRAPWLVTGLVLALAGTAAALVLRHRGDESSPGLGHAGRAPDPVPSAGPAGSSATVAASAPALPSTPSSPSLVAPGTAPVLPSNSAVGSKNAIGKESSPVVRHSGRSQVGGTRRGSSHRPSFDQRNPYQ